MPVLSKPCNGPCGQSNTDSDPVNPDTKRRWERLNGKGKCCYYCDTTYKNCGVWLARFRAGTVARPPTLVRHSPGFMEIGPSRSSQNPARCRAMVGRFRVLVRSRFKRDRDACMEHVKTVLSDKAVFREQCHQALLRSPRRHLSSAISELPFWDLVLVCSCKCVASTSYLPFRASAP